ncbi:hypothetical protein BKA81DRAFT_394740, partial [Phyllosticta paracitricarpa]
RHLHAPAPSLPSLCLPTYKPFALPSPSLSTPLSQHTRSTRPTTSTTHLTHATTRLPQPCKSSSRPVSCRCVPTLAILTLLTRVAVTGKTITL